MLPRSTYRRLLKLPFQPSSVWEGDRLSLNFKDPGGTIEDLEENRDCILWVDGVNGVVRAMDMVPATVGQEAIVRTLLQAIEQPLDTPKQISRPARPKKIVVRSREFQFFLRGVLQDLDITVEYQPELPLIDEFFSGLEKMMGHRIPTVPPQYADAIDDAVERLWNLGPWQSLSDHHILRITLPDLEEQPKLYVSILGQLGLEFGVLLYRSLDSLKLFRQEVVSSNHPEEVFFRQDCFYIMFNQPEDLEDDQFSPPVSLDWEDIDVSIGSIHPLEGMQHHLGEEEAQIVLLSIQGLVQFLQKHRKALKKVQFPKLSSQFKISLPEGSDRLRSPLTVEVCTEPEITSEILNFSNSEDEDDEDEDWDDFESTLSALLMKQGLPNAPNHGELIPIREGLVPKGAMVSMGSIPWEVYDLLGNTEPPRHQWKVQHRAGDTLPVLVIQTTRPKLKVLLDNIEAAGGLAGITFSEGGEGRDKFELGVLVLADGTLHLFNHYDPEDFIHQRAREKWEQRSTQTQGMCGLLLAHGLTGKNRGTPTLKEIATLIEVPYLKPNLTIR